MKLLPTGIAVVEGDTHLSSWIEENGTLAVAAGFLEQFRKFIPAGGVVADVGACLGDHTITYAEMVGSDGTVHAFEPNPAAYECLAHNMAAQHQVMLYPLGLGGHEGRGGILSEPNLGASQLFVDGSDGSVRITTLDSIAKAWTRLDWLKIDAEGWEAAIIEGARATIARLRPVMLVEVNRAILGADGAAGLVRLIESLNYSVKPAEPGWSMDMEMVDVLCIPA